MAFGIDTTTGFNAMSAADIRAAIVADLQASFGPLVDTSPGSELGTIVDVYTRQLSRLWSLASVAYNGFDRSKANIDQLISVGKLTGTARRAASYSTVAATVTLASGTALQAGVNFAQLTGHPETRFTPTTNFTAPSDGTHAVEFRAETTGAVECPAHALAMISTPVVGWTGIDNVAEAVLGIPVDSAATMKTRQEEDAARRGTGTVAALEADLLDATVGDPPLPFVVSAKVLQNLSSVTNANGLPPHSFEAIVYDGTPSSDQSNAIAQAIWDNRPAGIRPVGTSSGTAVDKLGANRTVAFTRVTAKPVFVSLTVVVTDSAAFSAAGGAGAVQAAIVAAGRSGRKAGDPVVRARLVASAFTVAGVGDVTSLTLDFTSSPTATSNLATGARSVATFDESLVVVT